MSLPPDNAQDTADTPASLTDQEKTREQLLDELAQLRQRLAQEEQAREARDRLHAILMGTVECFPFMFYAIGLDGRYVLQNAICRKHHGDVRGKRPEDICPDPETLRQWQENNRRSFAGESVEEEVECHVGGQTLKFRNLIEPIRHNGRILGSLGIIIDITEEKRAQQALQEAQEDLEQRVEARMADLSAANHRLCEEVAERQQAEERFRVIFEEAPVGMTLIREPGVLVKVNRALCQMSGYSEEEFVGLTVSDITHPADQNRTASVLAGLFSPQAKQYKVEKRYLGKRRVFWGQATVAIIPSPDGKPNLALAIVEDITQRKRTYEALQKERRTLHYMLRANDHERQLIAYDIHDGLAQHLAGAIMQFQVFEHFRQIGSDEAQVQKAYQAGMGLLQQAHFEARRLISGVRPPILDDSGVVPAIAHLVNELGFQEGPKIEFFTKVRFRRLAPTLENVIYRIVQEGLTNAFRHSKSESVRVALWQRRDTVGISIRDWGIGFDIETAQQNRFGLEGIRERVRLLGGKCSIRSQPQAGTSILVRLPLAKRE